MLPKEEAIKVLYVDDEEGNLMAFRASFRRDFDVQVAKSAEEALAWLEVNRVHVVISDQRMPGMTGAEFLGIVRKRWPDPARLLLTGYSDLQAVVDAVNLGGIHAYITKPWDPTDLKLRVEQAYELHALREERERLYRRYQQVFEASGDPIVIMDAHGAIIEVNRATELLLRTDRATLLAGGAEAIVEDLPGVVQRLKTRREGNIYRNIDITLRTRDGHAIDCLATATAVGHTKDSVRLFQVMIKDITDRKQEENRLKKLNRVLDQRVAIRTKQLRDALDDLGAFSYSVAHDLRSPLKNIKALSEHLGSLALMRGDQEERDLSQRIHKGAARLITLVDDLLRFSRAENQHVELAGQDLAQLAQECMEEMALPPGGPIFLMPHVGEAVIHADRAMLKVALNNLISNAVKFTREKEAPRVELGHARQDDGSDLVWVKDNGVGFDSGKNEQMFGVFKRLHPASRFEGSGIGLALVDRIMKKHGGSCWAEGQPDQGATIFLRFPPVQAETSRMAC